MLLKTDKSKKPTTEVDNKLSLNTCFSALLKTDKAKKRTAGADNNYSLRRGAKEIVEVFQDHILFRYHKIE